MAPGGGWPGWKAAIPGWGCRVTWGMGGPWGAGCIMGPETVGRVKVTEPGVRLTLTAIEIITHMQTRAHAAKE